MSVTTGLVTVESTFHPTNGQLSQATFRWTIDKWQQIRNFARGDVHARTFRAPYILDRHLGVLSSGRWMLDIVEEIENTRHPPSVHLYHPQASVLTSYLAVDVECVLTAPGVPTVPLVLDDHSRHMSVFRPETPAVALAELAPPHPLYTSPTLQVEVVLSFRDSPYAKRKVKPCAPDAAVVVQNRLSALYDQQIATDFVLVSGDGKELLVHRVVLAGSCEYFRGMLEHKTQEMETGVCTTVGVDYETLEIVVDWLYGAGGSPRLLDVVEKVLAAADMYQLTALKEHCQKFLLESLKPDNAVERFVLATEYEMEGLLRRTVACVAENFEAVVDKGGLELLEARAPELKHEFHKVVWRRTKSV